MRFYAVGLAVLIGSLSGCESHLPDTRRDDIETAATASEAEWKSIKANVHEVHSAYGGTPESFGTVLKQVHIKMCIAGLLTDGNVQLLTNTLKFKANALGATGITKVDLHIVPWRGAAPAGNRCVNGYMEGTATALILDKKRFPYLYPDDQDTTVRKLPN